MRMPNGESTLASKVTRFEKTTAYHSHRQIFGQTKRKIRLPRESLAKGKAYYSSPPCTNSPRLAVFDNANIIYLFTKQTTLVRRLTVL
jgi:hypothetical protein